MPKKGILVQTLFFIRLCNLWEKNADIDFADKRCATQRNTPYFGIHQPFSYICSLNMLPNSLLRFTNKHKSDGSNDYSSHIDTIEDSIRAIALFLPGMNKSSAYFYSLNVTLGRVEDGDLCSQAGKHTIFT